MFEIKPSHIIRLAKVNSFPVPDNEMFFFGLRGCLPIDEDSTDFKQSQMVETIDFDHKHPRCTLGQYDPEKGIALFPGSTVPHLSHIQNSLEKGGRGTNMLLTGYHKFYRKGWHKRGKITGHEAFRFDGKLPVRRTADDLDYDSDDRVEYTRPYDNLHAAWSMGTENDYFASAGCQVILGFPKCKKRVDNQGDELPDTAPWKTFKENVYAIAQNKFGYMLLHGRDALKISHSGNKKVSARLRIGSKGELVTTVQKELKKQNYYEGNIDDDFGPLMLRAVLEFQEDKFGSNADDGIVGPLTASGLGINWPTI